MVQNAATFGRKPELGRISQMRLNAIEFNRVQLYEAFQLIQIAVILFDKIEIIVKEKIIYHKMSMKHFNTFSVDKTTPHLRF